MIDAIPAKGAVERIALRQPLVGFEFGENGVDRRRVGVIGVGKPADDRFIGVDHDDHRVGDIVAVAALGIALVDQAEGADNFGLRVGEHRVLDFPHPGKAV